jgi:hypothetical protein
LSPLKRKGKGVQEAKPKILSIEWAAGFVEGEGYIGFVLERKPNKDYPRLKFTVCQTNREPLDTLKSILDCGNVRGPYGPYSGNRQPHYQFNIHLDNEVIEATEKLMPYLFQKGEQAKEAIRQYKEYTNGIT